MTMTTEEANVANDVGESLRYARKRIGLTLKEVAQKIGCSESLLSKIERGRIPPTLQTLYKLADILGVNVASLFSDDNRGATTIYNQGERLELNLTSNENANANVVFERMIPYQEGRLLDANLHVIPPGGGSSGTYSHRGEEVGYVVAGYIELTIDGQRSLLAAGGSFFFDSELPHSYRNIGSDMAKVVWVASLRPKAAASH